MTNHSDPDADRWHHLTPSDEQSDPARAFWGDAEEWPSEPSGQLERPAKRSTMGSVIGRWWSSAGGTTATRTHGIAFAPADADPDDEPLRASGQRTRPVPDDSDPTRDGTAPDPAPESWDDGWETADVRPKGGVDPLLARFGGVAVVLTLLVPVAMSFTSGTDDGVRIATGGQVLAATAADGLVGAPSAAAAPAAASTTVPPSAAAAPAPTSATVPHSAAPATTAATTVTPVPPASAPVQGLTAPSCANEYEIVEGDFWIRIADGAGVDLDELFSLNGAMSSTPLFPGRSICLPSGATAPAPPSTLPAPSSAANASVAPAAPNPAAQAARSGAVTATEPATRVVAPASTVAPSPAPAAPRPPNAEASADEVQAIIRAVWPDDLEERALQIAWRESTYSATAKNYCCYGVFQIYWSAHRAWLAELGITSAEQLYDPTLNAQAALMLYQRAGGWGPWGG